MFLLLLVPRWSPGLEGDCFFPPIFQRLRRWSDCDRSHPAPGAVRGAAGLLPVLPWQGTPSPLWLSPLGTSIGILAWESSTGARGVPKNPVASTGPNVASKEQAGTDFSRSLSHLEGQEMVKPSGHFWLFFPAPEELCSERRTAHPAWSCQHPGISQYPTQPPCRRG